MSGGRLSGCNIPAIDRSDCMTKAKVTRLCWWCGIALPKGRRKYCSDDCAYMWLNEVTARLWWTGAPGAAMPRALKKANYQCEEPSCNETKKLEVHHIIPLRPGEPRHGSLKNNPINLIVLCRKHHEEWHHPPKPLKERTLNSEERIRLGQLSMPL